MPTITILRPTDQPTGHLRLLDELKSNLASPSFDTFSIMVAFARVGPLLRLASVIDTWKKDGKTIDAVFGVDHRGTTSEALSFGLKHFTNLRVAHAGNGDSAFYPTFHPKMYLLTGYESALCYLGSNNLTVGGTETNFEVFIRLAMTLPGDDQLLDSLRACWIDLNQVSLPLDNDLLRQLIEAKKVPTEKEQAKFRRESSKGNSKKGLAQFFFPPIQLKPASPLPKDVFTKAAKAKGDKKNKVAPYKKAKGPTGSAENATEGLVIQVTPHANGEVFLSTVAVGQNPQFFGYPFKGKTKPKKKKNQPYSQRKPDPIVKIVVYGPNGDPELTVSKFGLNTVFYDLKSDIRVTVPPAVRKAASPLSIMVMRKEQDNKHDYNIDIYPPNSPQYASYLAVCDQTMPSGGKGVGRKFGWL